MKFMVGTVSVDIDKNGNFKPLKISRELTQREVLFFLKKRLLFRLCDQSDFDDPDLYAEYVENITRDVNDWLLGIADECDVLSYDRRENHFAMGMFEHIAVFEYLKKKGIIASADAPSKAGEEEE